MKKQSVFLFLFAILLFACFFVARYEHFGGGGGGGGGRGGGLGGGLGGGRLGRGGVDNYLLNNNVDYDGTSSYIYPPFLRRLLNTAAN